MGDFQGGVLYSLPRPGLRCASCGIPPGAYWPEEQDTGRETSEAVFHGTAPLPSLLLMTVETRGARQVVDVGQQLVALLDA